MESFSPESDSYTKDGTSQSFPVSTQTSIPGTQAGRPLKQAIVIELCAGSAKLSAACAKTGLTAIAVDQASNRHQVRHHVMTLDLTDEGSWQLLRRICETHEVIWVHIAPPCGTASRARDRPMTSTRFGPRPLRSLQYPMGLPFLRGRDLERVQLANKIYLATADFCAWLSNRNIYWSVENPGRSYLWELPCFIRLRSLAQFFDFDSCMHGGARAKFTSFLSNSEGLFPLCLRCDGSHQHLPWGLLPDGTFPTAQEAEYPLLLCERIAQVIYQAALDRGFLAPTSMDQSSSLQVNSMAVQSQPRSAMPPYLPEFAYVTEVLVTKEEPSLDSKGKLTKPFHSVPAGAKRLKTVRKRVGMDTGIFMMFGVYRKPWDFVDAVMKLPHPFDLFCDVPDCVLKLIFMMLTKGPIEMAQYRMQKIGMWRRWLTELRDQEKLLHDNMHPDVEKILNSKNILLLKRIANSFDWPDRNLFEDMVTGFSLTGVPKLSGVFPSEASLPKVTVDHLDSSTSIIRKQLWWKIGEAAVDEEVWDITNKEASDDGWLIGPLGEKEIDTRFNGDWAPVRRFGIQQSGKTRVIDDFSENGTNSAFAAQEKIDLKALDHLAWCAATISNAAFSSGVVRVKLVDGEVLEAPVHRHWKSGGEKLVTKTVDLKSAYKQLAIHPGEQRRSVISVKHPKTGEVFGFVSRTLPFGASAAVLAFNRVARLVWRVLVDAGILCTNYFDDYPVLEFSGSAAVTVPAIRSVMSMLGFRCSVDKEVDFSEKTEMLGVCFDTTDVENGNVLISNKPSRVEALSKNIDEVLKLGSIKSSDVARLFGRLQFAEHQLSGRIGKLALAELRQLEDSRGAVWNIDEDSRQELELLRFRLCRHPPRRLNFSDPEMPVFVFTDGACEPSEDGSYMASVGGVIICGSYKQYFGGSLDDGLVQDWLFDKKHIIGLVELYAVVLARHHWDSILKGRRAVFFVDNIPSMRSLIKGTSTDKQWRRLLRSIEVLELGGPTYSWFARVPSDSNIADGPSRNDYEGLQNFEEVSPLCLYTNAKIKW